MLIGAGTSNLVQYAADFLEFQETYRVNAVFAAAVTINECGAGTNLQIGGNNWFSIRNTSGGWNSYSSPRGSIEDFYKQIAIKDYYFTDGKYTVHDIGMVYCEDADVPGGWIENVTTFMTNMFHAVGINPSSSETTETGEAIVELARSKLGCSYVWGATGPNTFDCSGLTQWCYQQVGISIPRNSEEQKNGANKKVSVSEARVGDILWMAGHVGIYIGNNQLIESPQAGDVVKISNGASGRFTYALQYY